MCIAFNVVDPFEVEEDAWAEDSLGTVNQSSPLGSPSIHFTDYFIAHKS